MERQLSYALKPSLKEMALGRVAVALWMKPDAFDGILQFPSKHTKDSRETWSNMCAHIWSNMEGGVEHSMTKLPLPGSIQKQLIPILTDVGLGILNWILFHQEYFSNPNDYFRVLRQKMRFTAAGAVDDRKTAEELVACDLLDVVGRFRLACIYCLESRIPPLWRELPPIYKDEIGSIQVEAPDLHSILPSVLEREKSKSTRFLLCLNPVRSDSDYVAFLERWRLDFNPSNDFECAALLGHKTLAERCFQKLKEEERRTSLIRSAKGVLKYRMCEFMHRRSGNKLYDFSNKKTSDVVCYLLSLMTPEEQILIFKELPCEVLSCFLDWPWRDLFSDISGVVWPFLPESKYHDLRGFFVSKFNWHYYFPKFFQNFFWLCPIPFRRLFVYMDFHMGPFFFNAVAHEDRETIRVAFGDFDRVKLVSSFRILFLINHYPDKWPVLEEFLQGSAPSREDKRRLKEAFTEHLVNTGKMEGANDKYRSFFRYVDDVDESPAREDGDLS